MLTQWVQARFEEEMRGCCYPGWDIRELRVEVTTPPIDLGNVDARVLAVIKSALPRASGSS